MQKIWFKCASDGGWGRNADKVKSVTLSVRDDEGNLPSPLWKVCLEDGTVLTSDDGFEEILEKTGWPPPPELQAEDS